MYSGVSKVGDDVLAMPTNFGESGDLMSSRRCGRS